MNPLFAPYLQWSSTPPLQEEGVIVASDLTQQWLLPWFWEHYTRHSDYPVAFVDFGMSLDMKEWCQKRGHYISLPVPDIFVTEKQQIPQENIAAWEDILGKTMWESRPAWFKKPLACLQTPFRYSLWIDLDCQILKPIDELFAICKTPPGLALSKEAYERQYNAGVIAFERDLPLFEQWADLALSSNHSFPGDEDILCHLIHTHNYAVHDLPARYNWSRFTQEKGDTVILHWHGPQGKSCIQHQLLRSIADLYRG